jgi:hypothetical protein
MTLRIQTLDIPEEESIPETLSIIFETDNMEKDEAIVRVLKAMANGWQEIKSGRRTNDNIVENG